MPEAIQHVSENQSNAIRSAISRTEPVSLRTYTPSMAVLERSQGCFHFTPEGRRLFDYTSGVLVANLGHNPVGWTQRLLRYLGWDRLPAGEASAGEYFPAPPLTAYNAITTLESAASERLLASLQQTKLGGRLQKIAWAASGSEAVQKALWAGMRFRDDRDHVMATRHGFHGKKGLAGAVTGSEDDAERDPRVHFVSFPRAECSDLDSPEKAFDADVYLQELESVFESSGGRIGTLITEPYLGGGGSYHPPAAYLQLLERFCRDRDIVFILDEVQSNFGRTGRMYAFESYGIEPDFVCLGKGLGNGVPVSAAVGRADLLDRMKFGETSDTWSANPMSCASVLATLDEFETRPVLEQAAVVSGILTEGLRGLKQTGIVTHVRGEGMVFGIQCGESSAGSPSETANAVVRRCYQGDGSGTGIHLLGPLAGCVLRVSPPLTISEGELRESLRLLHSFVSEVAAAPISSGT